MYHRSSANDSRSKKKKSKPQQSSTKKTKKKNENIETSSNIRPSQMQNISRNRSKTQHTKKQRQKSSKKNTKKRTKPSKKKTKLKSKTNSKTLSKSKTFSKSKTISKTKPKKSKSKTKNISSNNTRIRANTVKSKNKKTIENDNNNYPWDSWNTDETIEEKEDNIPYDQNITRNKKQNNRTNSMSSVAEFLYENKKREKEKKRELREKKNNKNYSEYRKTEKVEYYKKHKKHKKQHRVKRSSLPTYNSLRNDSLLLKKHLQKESQRNLASLMLDPNKRLKSKTYKNLTAGGFEVHINKRYKLVDGRIGICRFKGRTMFGKSSEDWIGIILEVGDGEHDGTVQGKSYFKCRHGRGIMVRPLKITDYLGSCTKMLNKKEIKAAEKAIKKYQKMSGKMETLPVENGGYLEDHADDMLSEKTYHPMSVLNRNKGKKVKKKARYYEV